MTFISVECEELFSDYIDLNNPYGQKKDKRIKNWISLLSKIPSLENAKSDLLLGVNIRGISFNSHTFSSSKLSNKPTLVSLENF